MRYGQLFIDVGDITKEVRINWSSVVLKWWQIVGDIHTLYVLYVCILEGSNESNDHQ